MAGSDPASAAGAVPEAAPTCPVCGETTEPVGTVPGHVVTRDFQLRHCPSCRFSFVANPCTDYARIYDEAYYHGRGADPLVDYVFELDHPEQTIRRYEWDGIAKAVRSLAEVGPQTRWLDYGCGNGGLVRHVRGRLGCQAFGYDVGWITTRAKERGLPVLDDRGLDEAAGSFDVVTAIEVLEHVPDPVQTLRQVRTLLKPGGLFFYTTGNARPFRGRLAGWGYVRPDIHISFFEPQTLEQALRTAGFAPQFRGFLPGFTDIIRFKVLKNLGVRRYRAWQRLLPWSAAARALDLKLGISRHPVAWARA